jgi:lipid A 4'-phosphatase
VTFLVIWLVHGYIYRWPSTRMTDAQIDAALTRFAWPGYALARRLLSRHRQRQPSFVRRITEVHPDD